MKKKLVLLVVIFALIIPQSIFAGSSDEKIKTKIRYDKAGQKIGESKISTKKNKDGEEVTIEEKFDNNGNKTGQRISKSREPISLNQTQDVSLKAEVDVEDDGVKGWWVATTTARWDYWAGDYSGTSTGSSKSYENSFEEVYQAIDLIFVKTQVLVDGTILGSRQDSNTNASTATALAKSSKNYFTTFHDLEGITSHKFEDDGFQDWYPTTNDIE
ncbi:hypothetical protein [Chengkuizengella sediminis]|uniref:hypothetical protein n=1 Tax=Chengkuizengella sediminis TaxID=1885917 RepID=UPI00138998D6|nr:hypothetical protein [Chengkuizengella sediminis]NDI36444.1 hypothetical protein [Chengkuizengella sediminis]